MYSLIYKKLRIKKNDTRITKKYKDFLNSTFSLYHLLNKNTISFLKKLKNRSTVFDIDIFLILL